MRRYSAACCLSCVVRWPRSDFIIIADKLRRLVCHHHHNKEKGARRPPVFHKTAACKVLANLICPSQYFQKQPVSPSAKQWERPQDNKISLGWPGEVVLRRGLGEGVHMMRDPTHATPGQSKPSLLFLTNLTLCHARPELTSLKEVFQWAKSIAWVLQIGMEKRYFSLWSAVKMPALIGLADWFDKGWTNDCFGGTPSACKANSSTRTSAVSPAKNGWSGENLYIYSILPPSEANVGASSSVVTLNCATTVCATSRRVRVSGTHSDGEEMPSCVGETSFGRSAHTEWPRVQ